MSEISFSVFPTAVGPCGIVWRGATASVLALMLPEASEPALRRRLDRHYDSAAESSPPPSIARVTQKIAELLEGRPTDLSDVELDMAQIPAFHRRVYTLARSIPFGATMSYGELAERLGCPNAARAVGQALGRNPWALIVPCHRVLAKNGKLTGFSAHGGLATKRRLLQLEGVTV